MKARHRLIDLVFMSLLSTVLLFAGVSYYVVMSIVVLLVIYFELGRMGDLDELGITTKRLWPSIRAQVPFTVLAASGLLLFALMMGYAPKVPGGGYAVYWLVSVPLQEFIFRGYAQSVVRGLMPMAWAVLTVSLVFSLVHYFASTPYFWLLMILTFGAGFAWGYTYEKERNLLGPIFSHLVLGTLIFLILPSYGI